MKHKILLLAGKGDSSFFVMNWLEKQGHEWSAVLEDDISKKKFFKYRIKKLGIFPVIGQLLFLFSVKPLICFLSKKRKADIIQSTGLESYTGAAKIVLDTNSINDEQVKNLIIDYKPSLILVNGTRIISKKILNATEVPFINMHAGKTPAYRGVHGAYWAYYNKDAAHAGVTLHYVDKGVDTGKVIGQKEIEPTQKDNYCTYPLLQLAAGLDLLATFLDKSYEEMESMRQSIPSESAQWYHPTIWQYIAGRLRGVQ